MLNNILQTINAKGYVLFTRPFELNIVGVRSRNARPNAFDDTIHVFYQRADKQWVHNAFAATTDPGTYWLKKLMNPAGTAILQPGQYLNAYRIGVHRNKYQALVQQGPVTVIRDANQDGWLNFDSATTQTGLFGINIHRAAVKGKTQYVNDHSAGCQVLADANDFHLLMELAQRHKKWYGNNFTYTLLAEQDIVMK
ncbi:MAG TPA: hypothetical protein VFV31_00570 [Chitinophagaceae bacterium]|nr:hypothetical protein [Chitinophagaceae bacterium]